MELLVFGHAGARVLAFPTSNGKFYEWEDRGMPDVIRESLEKGWLQLYCVDSADSESWYAFWTTPAGRAYRYAQYDSYLYNEVLPFTEFEKWQSLSDHGGCKFWRLSRHEFRPQARRQGEPHPGDERSVRDSAVYGRLQRR